MAARTAIARAPLDSRIGLLAWAPPLLALGLCAAIGIAKHNAGADAQALKATMQPATIAGAGSAMFAHAAFQ